jgi:ribonuclease HII
VATDLYRRERRLARSLGGPIAGVDEAGRGPLAGPVVAAAVILPPASPIPELADSKTLSEGRRLDLFRAVRDRALAIGVGWASSGQVDRLNILRATHRAMRDAVRRLQRRPVHILVDGLPVADLGADHTAIVRGDSSCACICAASIVAKVLRDRLMVRLARRYPLYGFERNKGYPTAEHCAALALSGPCVHHRRSFAPVREALAGRLV